jgi:fibronectin type III domain protein
MGRKLHAIVASRWLVTVLVTVALTACGGGGGGAASSTGVSTQSVTPVTSSDSGAPGTSQSSTPAPSSGAATLSWAAPDQNTDGSALTNLAGYRIYFGTSADTLNQVIDISNVGVTTYVVDDLTSGTYYFSIRAYNTMGVESALSNVVTDTIS